VYNPVAVSSLRHTHLAVLALLIAAFVTLYPLMDCGLGGCPEAWQSTHAAHSGLSSSCLVAVLIASLAPLASTSFFGRRRAADDPRLGEACLSPDPPPTGFLRAFRHTRKLPVPVRLVGDAPARAGRHTKLEKKGGTCIG
jgi:hypothetical protein